MKTCTTCSIAKDTTEFSAHPKMKDGLFNECKACKRVRARAWREANKERLNAENKEKRKRPEWEARRQKQREYHAKNAPKIAALKKKSRLKVYGLTEEQYQEMLEQQNHVCAICGNPPSGDRWGKLCVDHNHVTGKVRALLCMRCNTAIGKFDEDVERIRAAAAYVEKHNQV